MFMGEFQHAVDEKGRLIIPVRFRAELGERFVLTKGLDNCLFVYPWREWEQLAARLQALPFTRSDARAFSRFLLAGASECEMDRQGRILLPQHLREYARLEKDVVLIGVSSRVEIWNAQVWAEYSLAAASAYESLAEKLDDLQGM